jgi:pilus assembly protein Flp/PilA
MSRTLSFLLDDDGATAVEYAVMLAMILMACFSMVALVGQESLKMWTDNDDGLQKAFNP